MTAIDATVAGRRFHFTAADVRAAVAEHLPEPIKDHYAVIDGRRYPPKQVVQLVTGLDRADFTTHHARRLLRRLGFTSGRRSDAPLTPPPPRPDLPHGGRQAEALRPYIGKYVALRGVDEVLVAHEDPLEVVAWCQRHDCSGSSMFRVPAHEWEAEGLHGMEG